MSPCGTLLISRNWKNSFRTLRLRLLYGAERAKYVMPTPSFVVWSVGPSRICVQRRVTYTIYSLNLRKPPPTIYPCPCPCPLFAKSELGNCIVWVDVVVDEVGSLRTGRTFLSMRLRIQPKTFSSRLHYNKVRTRWFNALRVSPFAAM